MNPTAKIYIAGHRGLVGSALIKKHGYKANRSQIVTGSQKHRDPRFSPFAFTEHGALIWELALYGLAAMYVPVFTKGANSSVRQKTGGYRIKQGGTQ